MCNFLSFPLPVCLSACLCFHLSLSAYICLSCCMRLSLALSVSPVAPPSFPPFVFYSLLSALAASAYPRVYPPAPFVLSTHPIPPSPHHPNEPRPIHHLQHQFTSLASLDGAIEKYLRRTDDPRPQVPALLPASHTIYIYIRIYMYIYV